MIKPEEIPQYTGNLELLEKAHGDLKTDAGHIRDTGADVHTHFQGLSAYYKAPEAERLFASTKPVKDRADTFADDLGTVSTALSEYATEIRPLVTKLTQLKTKATTFVNDNKDDDDWEYDEDKVDEHNQLRDDITATVAAFWAAERTCHNKITALFGGTQMVAGDGSKAKNQYGFNAGDMKNAKLPWGDPVEEKHHVWEVGHWVKSFVWDGIIVDGVWGTIKGLGTLVGVDGWDAAGKAWKGLAQLGTGIAISTIPGAREAFWGLPDDKLPSWLRDSRNTMKQTGKALVAWDEWGKNPGRAAGAVTFNVVTTVFTGGAGGAAAGAGKAGAVAKALSVAGKAGRVIDPMTYVAKGAGAGLSKIGDIAKGLKGIGNVDIPKLPEGTVTLPEGSLLSPDGTVHPPGTPVAEGAIKVPEGSVKLPDGGPVLPPDTIKLPGEGAPRYMDTEGNIYKADGTLDNDVRQAPPDTVDRPTNPTAGADTPRVETPAREPALVGAGARTADNAAHIRLGDSAGDIGRVGDDLPGTPHTGDNLPGGGVGDNLPGGHAGDHLPGGSAHDLNHGPSASHEPPTGTHHTDTPHHGGHDNPDHSSHNDSSSHSGHDGPSGEHGGSAPEPHGGGGHGADGPHHHDGNGPDGEPQGKHVTPQPGWHGQSADKMRHYRRPALDVSDLSREGQLTVLERESDALADEALRATSGEAPPGQNHLGSGCAGSFLHDNVITAHSSTTKMHGQKLPNTHHVLDGVLKDVGKMLDEHPEMKRGTGHGKCAEISLISDRLHQLDPTGTSIRTIDDARNALEGSVMHTRQIGDQYSRKTGELTRSHGDYLAPCPTCEHVLPQLGIRVHS